MSFATSRAFIDSLGAALLIGEGERRSRESVAVQTVNKKVTGGWILGILV